MKFLIHEKLSPHKSKTPEGYLVCVDAVLARTGEQDYYTRELWPDAEENKLIKVMRCADDVFAPEAIASFENKPITCEHPEEDVIPDNYKTYSVGFARDIRRGKDGDDDVLIGNLVITDPDCINDIENGIRTDLSCGYNCDITDEEHPRQINIRGNHIALCEQGRAGNARIVDAVKKSPLMRRENRDVFNYIDTWNGFTNADPNVEDIIKGLKDLGYNVTRQSINGWYKLPDGIMRKDYVFTFDDYNNTLYITLYADPGTWKTFEVSAYISSGDRTVTDEQIEKAKRIMRDRDICSKRLTDMEYSDYFKRELRKQLEEQHDRLEADEGIQNEQTKEAYDETKKNLIAFLREQLKKNGRLD